MELPSDPPPLDVLALARAGSSMNGHWRLERLQRLRDLLADAEGASAVRWKVAAELRTMPGGRPQPWLRLDLEVRLPLVCQRCLEAVDVPLAVQREFRFAVDEAAAAAEDADCEEDVLALSDSLDLATLIEDELLLSLPLVPMHGACPVPLPAASGGGSREKPLAGLGILLSSVRRSDTS